MNKPLRPLLVGGGLFAAALANAGISAVSGETVNLDANPGTFNFSNVKEGKNESDTSIWAFSERKNVVLASDLTVSVVTAGSYYKDSSLPSHAPKIAKGTKVNSYMLYSDPVHQPKDFAGTVTFNEKIIGVIVGNELLEKSDAALGRVGTTYPTSDDARGLELGDGKSSNFPGEGISWSGNTITFDARTHDNVDEIRIVTAAAVPEPMSMGVLGLGVVGMLRRRTRRS